jgi:hypothetical protein
MRIRAALLGKSIARSFCPLMKRAGFCTLIKFRFLIDLT